MQLSIDSRERMFSKFYADVEGKNVKIISLDMGDFQISDENEVLFIAERKTIQDLKSSIIDGRYREQKDRLLSYRKEHESTRIVYILEGKDSGSFDPKEKMLNGSIINTILRDQISFMHTRNHEETWDLIWDIYERYQNDKNKFQRNIQYSPSLPTHMESISKVVVTPKKRENIDTLVLQLACIDGLGTRKAYDIINKLNIKNMYEFCKLLETNELENVKGIGKGLATKIKLVTLGNN